MAEVRRQVAKHPEIAALLIINPDNPTGMVYPKAILEECVAIAREYKLFLIADEVYANLTYDQADFISLGALQALNRRGQNDRSLFHHAAPNRVAGHSRR